MLKKYKNDLTNCILIALFTLVFAFYCMNLWNYDFKVPLWYREFDNIATAIIAKRWMHISDIFSTNLMGAPFNALNIDFPMYGEIFEWSFIKLFSNIFNSYGIGINIFFISLFPITAIISYLVMNSLNIKKYLCVLGSVIYTFLPYRFFRNTAHLTLACYWQIPLAVLIMFWFYKDKEFFIINKKFFSYKKNLLAIILMCLIAWSGIYYTFFVAYFIIVIFILKVIKEPKVKQLYFKSITLLINLSLPILIASIPTKIMLHKYGTNSESPIRNAVEAEVYGMKITQLFLPNKTHGIKWIEQIRKIYESAPLPNEGSEYLGIIGIIGFLILLFVLFCNIEKGKYEEIVFLSKLNLSAILLGTIGGIGSLFALIVSPQIRSYNRISIFIAYFSILAVELVLTKINVCFKYKNIITILVCIIFSIGLWDECFYYSQEEMQQYVNSYYSDEHFVKEIEKQVTQGAMIYQIPFSRYPESGITVNAGDYFLARGYLHSNTLRWSYGDQKGRIGDRWNVAVSKINIKDKVDIISHVGFEGIYIDTLAIEENELEYLETQLKDILGIEPIVSENGRLLFYNLTSYNDKFKEKYSEEQWNNIKKNILEIVPNYKENFSEQMNEDGVEYRNFGSKAILELNNITDEQKSGKISFTINSVKPKDTKLYISVGEEIKEYKISLDSTKIEFDYTILPQSTLNILFSTETEEGQLQIKDVNIN